MKENMLLDVGMVQTSEDWVLYVRHDGNTGSE